MEQRVIRIRPALENEDRGPLYVEPAIAALHSLGRFKGTVGLEIGMGKDGKIAFFARSNPGALRMFESQLYAQYPEINIELEREDPFTVGEDEEVLTMDLTLDDPEVFPIKRHPQFDDMMARINVDPVAGLTSSVSRYEIEGMRGHVQIVMKPLGNSFRRRALRFLPLLDKGLSAVSERYAFFFTRMVLSRGWRRVLYFPVMILMGGFRSWPGFAKFFSRVQKGSGENVSFSSDPDLDEVEKISRRSHDGEDSAAAAQDKVNRLLFLCNVRLSVIYKKGQRVQAQTKLDEIAGSFEQFSLPHLNAFETNKSAVRPAMDHGFRVAPYILSAEEVSTLWHMPLHTVQTPNIDWVLFKHLEPPNELPLTSKEDELTTLGEAVFRGQREEFGIRNIDRRRHVYVIGKTGMGKSTLLENMVFSDIHAGKGVGVIDPHGDLIDAVLRFLPKNRSNDVVLFDPADRDYPLSFNVLECPNPDQRTLVASGLMSVFTKLWPEAFSGRMEHILRNTLLALLEADGSSMLGIMRMFADASYRQKVVSKVTDPMVRSFWDDEFAAWSENYRTEACAAIQNKVGQLLSTPLIRNIVGQTKSTLNIRHAMDTGKIVLVNLSKGRLGEDASAFLGSILVTKFQIDAMSRADIPEKDRRDFYLYVDEFQNFATESFATILSEARKYRLSLTMANQYVAQLLIGDKSTALRDAVFGNVGSLLSFQVGSDDAEVLSLQYEEAVTAKDILSLPKYHMYMRLMIDGMPSKPFSVSTLPPPEFAQEPGAVDTIRRLSRERYSEKREVVEEKITKWAASAAEGRKEGKKVEKAKEKEEEEKKKARKKGMKLEEYRVWRDRELWTNEFNSLRKKEIVGEELTEEEKNLYKDLSGKLEKSGGIPELSKTLQELKEKVEKRKTG